MLNHIESRKKVEIDLKEKIKSINLKYIIKNVLFNKYKKFIFSSSQIDEEVLLTIFNKENEEQST
jgi:hypothetical protein